MKHTVGELQLLVRQERQRLTVELVAIEREEWELRRRRKKINDRMIELDKAENILEGGMH